MTQNLSQRLTTLALGGALVMGGYLIGANQHTATAQNDAPANQAQAGADDDDDGGPNGGAIGVSIPANGAALVKGADGNAYVVNSRGLYTRASQSGKPLELD